jgi:PAS domain S-box-containing protein
VQVDENGLIEFANERFGTLLGCQTDEVIGQSLDSVLKSKARSHNSEAVIQLSSGKEAILHISHAPINNEYSKPQGAVYVFTDVSRRKQAEQSALELSLEKERVRILTEFVQDASHEFYTPLSNIGTHAYLLGRHLKDETHLRYLDIISEQAEAIRSLISALVIMTRLDSTNVLQFDPANLVELVNSVVNRLAEQIQDKKHQLQLALPERHILVDCDVDMLLLAISNVIDNAIRYTNDKGFISIELYEDDENAVLIVEDTGLGMSQDVQVQMFKRFFRADKARSTRGFGLGMTITKRIIDLHFGEIIVESEEAQGTQIRLTLPKSSLV